MVYILAFILLIMLIVVLYINKWDIISPWVISVAMFFLSVSVAALNVKNWEFDVTFKCMAVIIGALLAFGLGEKTVERFFQKYPISADKKTYIWDIEIPVWITCVISIFMLLGFVIVFKRAYELSLEAGNPGGFRHMLGYVRSVMITPGNHMGRLCNHIIILSQSIAYVYLWVGINNILAHKIKMRHAVQIMPIILYLGMAATGAGRNFLIQMFAYVLIIFLFLSHGGKGWTVRDVVKVIIIAGSVIGLYLVLFLILGYLKGSGMQKVSNTLSSYIGSSIANLNEFISRPREENIYIGKETLYGLYSVLRKFGVNLPDNVYHLEYSVVSNVYTALRRYISDYGYVGLAVIQVYIGMMYSAFYSIIKRRRNGLAIILYGWIMHPLAIQAIEEVLMVRYVNTTSIYFIVYLLIIYYILIVKSESWKLHAGRSGN